MDIKHSLEEMEFNELRPLIDYCLRNSDKIEQKYLPFITYDIDQVSEYIDILESKNLHRPIYSPPIFIPSFTEPELIDSQSVLNIKIVSVKELKNESEQRITAKSEEIKERERRFIQEINMIGEAILSYKQRENKFNSKINKLEKELEVYQNKIKENKLATSSADNSLLFEEDKKLGIKQNSNILKETKGDSILNFEINHINTRISAIKIQLKQLNGQMRHINKKLPALEDLLKIKKDTRVQFLEKEQKNYINFVIAERKRKFKREVKNLNKLAQEKFDNQVNQARKEVERKKNKEVQDFDLQLNKYENFYKAELKKYEDSIRGRIIKRLRTDIINFTSYKVSAVKLNWKLLPIGEIPFNRLCSYLKEISKSSRDEFDLEKIEKIISLRADKIYCGIDDFDGYLVFYFEKIKVAVLDCPRKGNAIYIFGEDWKTLSRLTKNELLNYYSYKTERIIHRGDWFERLRKRLIN